MIDNISCIIWQHYVAYPLCFYLIGPLHLWKTLHMSCMNRNTVEMKMKNVFIKVGSKALSSVSRAKIAILSTVKFNFWL